MARNQVDVTVEQGANANGWTELTNADATSAKFQVKNGAAVIRYSTNDTEPAEGAAGAVYHSHMGEGYSALSAQTALSGAVRIFARPYGDLASVDIFIDHP